MVLCIEGKYIKRVRVSRVSKVSRVSRVSIDCKHCLSFPRKSVGKNGKQVSVRASLSA